MSVPVCYNEKSRKATVSPCERNNGHTVSLNKEEMDHVSTQ